MSSKRKFVQALLVFVHLLTAWVTYSSLTWMYELGLDQINPATAAIAMGVPGLLIGSMFKICQQYLAEYSKTGVQLEGAAPERKTVLELQGKLVEKEVEEAGDNRWVG